MTFYINKVSLLILVISVLSSYCKEEDLNRWNEPVDSLFNMEWRYQGTNTKYLKSTGDFDGNGIIDSVLILQEKDGDGLGVFVILKDNLGIIRKKKIFDSNEEIAEYTDLSSQKKKAILSNYKRSYGIKKVEPGKYTTACGKGYYDCTSDSNLEIAVDTINIVNDGIELFIFDAGGTRYFFWDEKAKDFVFSYIDD